MFKTNNILRLDRTSFSCPNRNPPRKQYCSLLTSSCGALQPLGSAVSPLRLASPSGVLLPLLPAVAVPDLRAAAAGDVVDEVLPRGALIRREQRGNAEDDGDGYEEEAGGEEERPEEGRHGREARADAEEGDSGGYESGDGPEAEPVPQRGLRELDVDRHRNRSAEGRKEGERRGKEEKD